MCGGEFIYFMRIGCMCYCCVSGGELFILGRERLGLCMDGNGL